MHQFHGRPIFIMGNQRSGTRMVAAILNQHPDIVITDEAHIFTRLYELTRQADNKIRNDDWPTIRREMAQTVMLGTSADYVLKKAETARRFGNKTPGLEFMVSAVQDLFPDALFIYCMRHPLKVLSSLERMPWNRRTVAENWERYKASVDIYEALRDRAMLVQIDQIENVADQQQLIEDLLEHVDAWLDPEMPYYATEEPWTPANTLQGGKPGGLSDRDVRRITGDPWYQSFCAGYGYTP